MTIPDVFIIESLGVTDVKIGNLLAANLRSTGKNPIFMTVMDSDSYRHALLIFKASHYRYLHIICHGNASFVSFHRPSSSSPTESISYYDFSNCFPCAMEGIRVFIAACELGNQNFSNTLMQSKRYIYSIVAPEEVILATQALYVWTTFYNQLFSFEGSSMKSCEMLKYLWKSVKTFNNNFHASIIHPSAKEKFIAHHHLIPHSTDSYKNPYDSTPIHF